MSVIPDLSDEGLRKQFGDILLELPELWEALRLFEIESRPVKSGCKMSVNGRGNVTRLRIGNAGSMK